MEVDTTKEVLISKPTAVEVKKIILNNMLICSVMFVNIRAGRKNNNGKAHEYQAQQ